MLYGAAMKMQDDVMEREEQEEAGASVGAVFGMVGGSRNTVNPLPLYRGRLLRRNGGRRTYHLLQYAHSDKPPHTRLAASSHRCV